MIFIMTDSCNHGGFDTDLNSWVPSTKMWCEPWDSNIYIINDEHETIAQVSNDLKHSYDIEWHGDINELDKERVEKFLKDYLHLPD